MKSLELLCQYLSLWKSEMSDSNVAAPNDTEDASTRIEILIGEKLEQSAPLSPCCIYRVPQRIRCLNPNAYTPKVVSIGPLHHGKETLQDMEEHKNRYLNQFLKRRTQRNLKDYIDKIGNHEKKLRSYYAEPIKFSSDDFISIILVDSAFIIELLLKNHLEGPNISDRILGPPYMRDDIMPDLLLLENQLPFFILEDLFDLYNTRIGSQSENLSITLLFYKFFEDQLDPLGVDYKLETLSSSEVKGEHFLDLARKLVVPLRPLQEPLPGKKLDAAATCAPTITELHQAGVKLKVPSTRNLFRVKFGNGILEIPMLTISEFLECMWRNLAAYEQCHHGDLRIADYLVLLDCFVNTPNDVELLVKYGIVKNLLGDNSEACSFINSLCKGILRHYDDVCFATLYEDLHKHCKRPWNRRKANLRQNYLNTPWAVVSVIAAAFLIILTVIQTVCSLISL